MAEPNEHRVKNLGEPVPVYSCHIYLSPPDSQGTIHFRGATLSELAGEGRTERETLANAVRLFKEIISRYTSAGQPIPWLAEPQPLVAGEQQRWIPVHF